MATDAINTIIATIAFDHFRDVHALESITSMPNKPELGQVLTPSGIIIYFGFLRHTIISCTGFVGGRGVQIKLAGAVLSANIKRYFPWQFGVDYDIVDYESAQDLFDEQLDVRALLRGQEKKEWVIISTGMFTSFSFEREFSVVDVERGVIKALGGWENRVTVTRPRRHWKNDGLGGVLSAEA
ncbi:hypothetical protein M422DRAFT_247335 [Sphaerobolus stellatus SS14]|nr:hypothetical protein M422DRAFT_247335 [Sphaerobolus stellatus SS14]